MALRAGHSLSEDQLWAPRRQAGWQITRCAGANPVLAELPKSLTGKVDRCSLRDILIAQADVLKQGVVSGV